MKKFFILVAGWVLTIVGAILSPVPMPVPFPLPIGITLFLVGCAILTTHSKTFRRGVQYIRHHNRWLSRGLEIIAKRTPEIMDKSLHRLVRDRDGRFSRGLRRMATRLHVTLTHMVHRTSPHAHGRRARMRSRSADDVA
jgi:hypothetical protein